MESVMWLQSYTGWAKKAGPQTHNHNFKKFTGRFLGKFAVKRILNIPPPTSGVTMGWLLRLVTGAPLVVGAPRQF